MLALAQTVFPSPGRAGHWSRQSSTRFPGEGCRIGRRRVPGPILNSNGISIADARSSVVEADHSK